MCQKELITMDSASDRGGGLPQLWHARERIFTLYNKIGARVPISKHEYNT
jgi:hypothetical protein